MSRVQYCPKRLSSLLLSGRIYKLDTQRGQTGREKLIHFAREMFVSI